MMMTITKTTATTMITKFYPVSRHRRGSGIGRRSQNSNCTDLEEEWDVTNGKINRASAEDSYDTDTDGTNFGQHVGVFGDFLETRR